MSHSFADARRWMQTGESAFAAVVAGLDEEGYGAASGLPGWSRKHVVAHVSANADALGNLIHWAATGEETPMYHSPEQRNADIQAGARRPGGELTRWLDDSATSLEKAMLRLEDARWRTWVRTAQGRTVPASEVPWMRSREVWIHAVDLDTGFTFQDLPTDFLAALVEDIRFKRHLDELPAAPLPEVAAWLAGRPHSLTDAPELGPWL